MLFTDGKYGSIHIDGRNIDIEKTDRLELEEYVDRLDRRYEILTKEQNDYISQIIK